MRGRPLAILLAVSLAAVGSGIGADAAGADIFAPIQLASAGTVGQEPEQQVEYAHDSVISAGGAYVVFDGEVAGERGVWRVDLATRRVQEVAGGDALLPSVSADGQYISFTTNQSEAQLRADTHGLEYEPTRGEAEAAPGPDNVYVRDMGLEPEEAGAFKVVSAVNGSTEPLTYAGAGSELGSVAAGGSAISADGQEVAFVTTAESNVAGPETPALQVAVRRLESDETILVSGEYDTGTGHTTERPVAGGGRGAVYGDRPQFPTEAPEYSRWIEARPPGAAISADGSTVAWMGTNVGLQARMLPDERPLPEYTEPLWRRISSPETSTERITGGSEPANPACEASGELALPEHATPNDPCEGPFSTDPYESEPGSGVGGIFSQRGEAKTTPGDSVPRLSADGYTVAFLSRAEPSGLGEFFSNQREKGEPADIYVADMHPGLTRAQSLSTLTRVGVATDAESGAISEFALSEDGEDVAFTTRRTQFRLADPAFVSAPASEPGLDEVFYVDLADGTLTRVTHGYDGEAGEQPHGRKQRETEDIYYEHPTAGATSPSFAHDGALLAFSSTASNLVPDDGNGPLNFSEFVGAQDGSDAFVVARETPVALPTPQYVSAAPTTELEPVWALGATAIGEPDGTVLLYVQTPGAGVVSASARSAVLVAPTARRASHRGHRKGARAAAAVATRMVAGTHMTASAADGQLLTLVLRPQKPYAALTTRAGGLSAVVSVSFTAAGHPRLERSLQVTFVGRAVTSHRGRASKKARRRKTRR